MMIWVIAFIGAMAVFFNIDDDVQRTMWLILAIQAASTIAILEKLDG